MQEAIIFEIGGQSYKLIGNDKESTARAAALVSEKYDIINEQSAASSNRELVFMLSALNLAEELLKEKNNPKQVAEYLEKEANKMLDYVQVEIDNLIKN